MVIPSRSCTPGRPRDYKCTGTYNHAHILASLSHTDVLQQSGFGVNVLFCTDAMCCSKLK